ncbi:MAG: C10 family peptidase [Muribaculaceae bacterium]|nr:C10 family peptidase [Muribaculaceae bacterium]
MKKYTLGFMMFLLGAYTASARQITPDEAMSVASDFMSSSELKSSKASNSALHIMKAPGLDANAGVSPYYIFNCGENDGFVIISGDDRAPKVLGYSDKGSFDRENLPLQMKDLMEQWAKQMGELPKTASQHVSWRNKSKTRSGEVILMKTAEWGQFAPFNDLCPEIDGQKSPAGCVATALAIVMKYHNWPDYTRGGIQMDFYYPDLSFNFDNYNINWSALDDPTHTNFDEEVSKLVYSVGVAAPMIYGETESSAEVWPLGHKLIELYAYAKGCQFIERKSYNDEIWNSILRQQLEEVGPVVYSGNGTNGHCFVIDGFDADGRYHVNWGWNGDYNGYYSLDFSDVGGMSFGDFQGMIINIRPDYERKEYSKSFITDADVYLGGLDGAQETNIWNFSSSEIIPGEEITFKMPFLTFNNHKGYYKFAVVDDNDQIIQLVDGISYWNNDFGNNCPYPGSDPIFAEAVFPELKDGQRYQLVSQETEMDENYHLIPDIPSNDPKDYKIVLGGLNRHSFFYATGNTSELAEVNFHIDEKVPALFEILNTSQKEFTYTAIKGHALGDNIIIPHKGVSFEINCTDKDGIPQEPVFVQYQDENWCNFNISLYKDYYDVYVKYDYDGDSRKDSSVSPELIIEQEGLIYKKVEGGVSLIGYDNVPEAVTIPDIIISNGQEYPIISIEHDALLFAPITELNIFGSYIQNIGLCAFAGMEQLKSVYIKNNSGFKDAYVPFLQTSVDNVYMDSFIDPDFVNAIIGVSLASPTWSLTKEQSYIYKDNINFYFNNVFNLNDKLEDYLDILYGLEYYKENKDKIFESFCIPGLGRQPKDIGIDQIDLPIREMWTYAIDRTNSCFKIQPEIEEIKIKSILVNGQTVMPDESCIYTVPSVQDMEVSVNYILHDRQEMTTVYDAAFNNALPSVAGVDGIFSAEYNFDVYDLNGVLFKKDADRESLKTLTPGIYLIRQGGSTNKLVIR